MIHSMSLLSRSLESSDRIGRSATVGTVCWIAYEYVSNLDICQLMNLGQRAALRINRGCI
jgi:hypothetical protein